MNAERIKTKLEQAGMAWASAPLHEGAGDLRREIPRLLATTADRLTTAEIVGPLQAARKVSLVGAMPKDRLPVAARNGMLLSVVLSLAVPQWAGSGVWLRDMLARLKRLKSVRTTHAGCRVTLTLHPRIGSVALTIEQLVMEVKTA